MTDSHRVDGGTTRRSFLRTTATTAAAGIAAFSTLSSGGCSEPARWSSDRRPRPSGGSGKVVLFQGDSITDAGRDRGRENSANDARAMGSGYAFLIASHFLAERSNMNLKFYNRGISGSKVFQLAERWDKDCLALKPDLISILIGVNDIWHTLNGNYQGTVEIYEKDYRALLKRTQRGLPGVKLVVCEPFVLRCGAVNEKWFPEFDRYRAAAKRIAGNFDAVFVPFQSAFDEAVKHASPSYWAADGVHPTMAGSYLMGHTWTNAVSRAKA